MEEARNRLLVVSAHPGDVLWRCAGAVAKHVKEGGEARIISLSYGIAGESVALWKEEGMTAEKAKQIRVEQMTNAAKVLGASCEIWDLPEYPFRHGAGLLSAFLGDTAIIPERPFPHKQGSSRRPFSFLRFRGIIIQTLRKEVVPWRS